MIRNEQNTGREITAYFNSPAFQPTNESTLLQAFMAELKKNALPEECEVNLFDVSEHAEDKAD